MSCRVLINYRREDSLGSAGRLYDRLVDHFSREQVFMDVDAIEPGVDFVEVIEKAVSVCDVFLAIIGPEWLTVEDNRGKRRLDNPDDFVRIEIAAALKRNIRVIPVLVKNAVMPQSTELPDDLRLLSRRNAIELSHARFDIDADRLIRAIERVFEQIECAQEKAVREVEVKDEIKIEDTEGLASESPTRDKGDASEEEGSDQLEQQASDQVTPNQDNHQQAIQIAPTSQSPKTIPQRWKTRIAIIFVVIAFFSMLGLGIFSLFNSPTVPAEPSATTYVILSTEKPSSAMVAQQTTDIELLSIETDTMMNQLDTAEATTLPPTNTFTPSEPPTQTPFPPTIIDEYGIQMVLIPSGSFEMGSTRGENDEKPVHTVTLDRFYMDQFEVTNSNYAKCVDAGVCESPSDTSAYTIEKYYDDVAFADSPVLNLSWFDAKKYCEWRESRLPTEAEWEKAAKGEHKDAMYPWGDNFDGRLANYCDVNCDFRGRTDPDFDDGYGDISPTGNYAPNGYELYDMAGNVWEWVSDWYSGSYYSNSPSNNPKGPDDGITRVLRGGSWLDSREHLRTTFRLGFNPNSSYYNIGFRCVKSP